MGIDDADTRSVDWRRVRLMKSIREKVWMIDRDKLLDP